MTKIVSDISSLVNIKKPEIIGLECIIVKSSVFMSKRGKKIGKLHVMDVNCNTTDILFFQNSSTVLNFGTGSFGIVYGSLKPTVWSKNGIKQNPIIWGKSLSMKLVVPRG